MSLNVILYFFGGLVFSIIVCLVLSKVAPVLKLIDKPNPERKFHPRPTPIVGGIALWSTMSFFLLLNGSSLLSGWWISISIMTFAGLIDDLLECDAIWKLILQFAAALFFVFTQSHISIGPAIIVILTIVLLINAVNYMDNSNGVCAGASLIILIGLYIAGALPLERLLAVSLFGAIMGFLFLNFPSGKVFLGDAGSHFLGATIAFSVVSWSFSEPKNVGSAICFTALPLFDMFQVTLSRIRRGQPILKSDPYHLTHVFLRKGFNLVQAVCFLWLIAFLTIVVGLLIPSFKF